MPAFISKNLPKKAHHSFIPKWCAKLQLFYIPPTFFLIFFFKIFKKVANTLYINTKSPFLELVFVLFYLVFQCVDGLVCSLLKRLALLA